MEAVRALIYSGSHFLKIYFILIVWICVLVWVCIHKRVSDSLS